METVSVVMCTYNGAKYLREQLDSILNQTYPIYELIVQDDCSTDDTVKILREYKEKYQQVDIYIYANAQNLGFNRNFFTAIQKAKGEYVAISDQDDIWEKEKIEIQMNSIGDAWLCSGFSKPFATDPSIRIHFDSRIPNYTLERMMYVGVTPGHTLLIRRDLIDKIPNLEKWISCYTYDKTLQMVAAAYEKVQFCNQVLVNNRRHLNASTFIPAKDYQRTRSNILQIVKRTFSLYRELRPFIREYFIQLYEFLSSIPANTLSQKNAMQIALYESKESLWSYLKLTYLCVKLRNRIFYTKEKSQLFSILRALYFPISCSDYFRYKSKNTQYRE